jgi:hypothetical protein
MNKRPYASVRMKPAAWVAAAVVLAAVLSPCARAQGDPPAREFLVGEDLIYNVRYGFIDLGQVRIKTLNTVRTTTSTAYQGKALIDSYRLPFVDLHAIFESLMDSVAFSRHFTGRLKDGDRWTTSLYDFQYDQRRVLIEQRAADSSVAKRDTLQIEGPCQDGLSLFFYARDHLYSGWKVNVPAVVKEQKVNAFINFRRDSRSVEVDAVEYPVDVVGLDGHLDFEGLYGLTGDFEGWFSNDEARIPILAKMKVLIGSVTIELMKWTRDGWVPPRAKG